MKRKFLTFKSHLKIFLIVICYIFAGIFSLSSFVQGQIISSQNLTEIEKKAVIGRDLIFHRRYQEALDYFKKLEVEYPNSPIGSFGQMGIWQARMFENYDFHFDQYFEEASKKNKPITEKIISDSNSSAWDLFLAGASSGLRGFYLIRKDAIFKALSEANASEKALKKALEKDPTLSDVYLGIGMNNYWRSVFTSRFKFLPFVKDKREQGLQEIEKSIREGRVVGALAEAALAFSIYESRNYNRVIPVLEKLIQNYPENMIVKNLLGDAYGMTGQYIKAHSLFDELIKTNSEAQVAKFFKAKIFYRQGNLIQARKWFEIYLSSNPPPAWASYALTDLGRLDLQEGKEEEAYHHFKKAYETYSDNAAPLKEINKMRDKRW